MMQSEINATSKRLREATRRATNSIGAFIAAWRESERRHPSVWSTPGAIADTPPPEGHRFMTSSTAHPEPSLYFSERMLWKRAEMNDDRAVLDVLARLARWRERAIRDASKLREIKDA